MPRTNIGKPEPQLRIERDLRSRYGNYIRQKDIIEYLGISRTTAYVLLRGVPAADVLGRSRRYSPERIAKLIYNRGEAGAWNA